MINIEKIDRAPATICPLGVKSNKGASPLSINNTGNILRGIDVK